MAVYNSPIREKPFNRIFDMKTPQKKLYRRLRKGEIIRATDYAYCASEPVWDWVLRCNCHPVRVGEKVSTENINGEWNYIFRAL